MKRLEEWKLICSDTLGFRDPSNHTNEPLALQGLLYFHRKRGKGIWKHNNGTLTTTGRLLDMPSPDVVSTESKGNFKLGQPEASFEKSFPDSNRKLWEAFRKEKADSDT